MSKKTRMAKLRAQRKNSPEKSKKHLGREPSAKPTAPKGGYDYGLRPRMMALGSFEFANSLRDANVTGVAYGFSRARDSETTIPFVSIIGKNREPLRQAFEQFEAWSKQTDGDSIELTFVFLKDGGYVIGLSPEPTRLEQRVAGFNRTHEPLYMLHLWPHRLATTSLQARKFREYKQGLLSPFFLCADVQTREATWDAGAGMGLGLSHVARGLLKFEATFVDEEDIEPNTIAAALLKLTTSGASRKGRARERVRREEIEGPPLPSPQQVAETRASALRRHFPVTLGRIASSSRMRDLRIHVTERGVQGWQFEQAICNLTLSADMGSRPHFIDVPSDDLIQPIADALSNRYESADGKGLKHPYTEEQVMKQVRLDTIYLLRGLDVEFGTGDLASLELVSLNARLMDMNLLSANEE